MASAYVLTKTDPEESYMMMITLEFAACAGIRDRCRPVSVLAYTYMHINHVVVETHTPIAISLLHHVYIYVYNIIKHIYKLAYRYNI